MVLIDYFSCSVSCPDPNDTTNWIALQPEVDTENNYDKVRTLVSLKFRSDFSCRF